MLWQRNGLNTPHTEPGWLVVSVISLSVSLSWWLYGEMYTRAHNLTESCKASAHLSIHMCLLLPSHPKKSIQPTFSQSSHLSVHQPPSLVVLLGECALLIPLSQPSQKAGSLSDAEGEKGMFGRASPQRGGNGEFIRPDPKLQESTGAINCQETAGSQCPLCRWGISCW